MILFSVELGINLPIHRYHWIIKILNPPKASALRAVIAIAAAPSPAKSSAKWRPKPLDAPVIKICFHVSRFIIDSLFS